MDWTETRNVLIVAGVTAERLPVDRQSRIDLSEADLRWADLCRANLSGADKRLAAYRRLKTDLGTNEQAALFGNVAEAPAADAYRE